uniref:Uncharacterized protein n=1 Tax=Siphoviridae sp. ctby413 TaxID=2827275 RepID=A0A8S5R4B9_9CAUD|nr:MAG TPA: hypothetical protein [Siphoviridae sp. ctby413]
MQNFLTTNFRSDNQTRLTAGFVVPADLVVNRW